MPVGRPGPAIRGFTYIGVLIAVAIIGVGLLAVSELWQRTAHRQHLAELEWAGHQIEEAIGSYYESSSNGRRNYPQALDDLLEDRRMPFMRRHLRQVYVNPFTGDPDWTLVRAADGGIRAVQATVPGVDGDVPSATREFGYVPMVLPAANEGR